MGRRRTALLVVLAVALALLTGPGRAGSGDQPPVKALFFGDSLVKGVGTVPQRPVMVRTAANRLGWDAVVDAVGGTGYTTGGRHGKPYLQRLTRDGFLRWPYDVIVLEGGTNDAHHGSLSQLRAAALKTVDYVHRRQPRARIVMVGAFAPAGIGLARFEEVDAVLRQVAADRGLTYISQLGYSASTDPDFLAPDQFHPSAKGYDQMGRDLAAALQGSSG